MRRTAAGLATAMVLGACAGDDGPGAGAEDGPATTAGSTSTTETTLLDYPDLALRSFWRAMREPRDVANSALPPRHYDEVRFPELLVDRTEIVPGGPPPDGIPSIDEPRFVAVDEVVDLEPDEAVLLLEHDEVVHVYPVRIMIWHEIVNDVVGDTPIAVTYCPLCNSAIGYERTVDGRVLDFGTSGYLYRSGLVMYDRQTESLWTHFDGRSVVGTLMGSELEFVSVQTVSWADARSAHPDARVLRGESARAERYGSNRYAGYDQRDAPLSGWFSADIPEPIAPMTRVVGIRTGDSHVAIPTDELARNGVTSVRVGDVEAVVFWRPGTASPLQRDRIADGDDIGATGVFDRVLDGRLLAFERTDGGFVDAQTGTTWNLLGQAIDGPLAGGQLRRLDHLDTFWFAWVGHHPQTDLVTAG